MSGGAQRSALFRELHQSGCFVMPNPWDRGSARALAQLGFKALATTSSGFAWSTGRADYQVPLDELLSHLRAIAASVDVPINADFEGGYARAAEDVAANVASAVATGIAGLSIEDSTRDQSHPIYEFSHAVDRIRAARAAIDASGTGVLLTGRYEGLLAGQTDQAEVIRRLVAYGEAGADCLYAPGMRNKADIATLVKAVAPKPVNVLVSTDFATVAELRDLGVRRISVGGALARSAWAGFLQAASEIVDQGTFTGLTRAASGAELNKRFASR